ncbi:uncharacterized mitochondrial protein AtMg00310-like [Dioscorea cayenensis subsp. rotundata]|uniref:Uncharacterized mitochondrial protein AtMg00310-like n=1 Tax=Dioscorea cayennensis subsp. rotundata TaxID=55577 RepID=A0AB40C7R3_DIOCR|nr:uncharacterized mitochondrial protein AtMg00310-like [Dioscorea cayenensis subsp. rotundata]
MSIYRLPSWVTKSIDKIRRDFLWSGPDNHQSKIRLVSWARLCRSREQGGWGILNLQTFNTALLGKWWWKIVSGSHWCGENILHANYYSNFPMWNLFHTHGRRRSFFWNGVLHSLPAFRKNLSSQIRNGANTLFWLDNWVEGRASADIWPQLFQVALYKEDSIRDFMSRLPMAPLSNLPDWSMLY